MPPVSAQTALLLHFDGDDGESVFADSSENALTVTAFGAFTSTTQSKFGGASGFFNNTRLEVADADGAPVEALTFGTGPFTIDYWVYITGGGSYKNMLELGTLNNYPSDRLAIHVYNNGRLTVENTGAGNWPSDTAQFPLNEWVHVAVTRDNANVIRLFKNGQLVGTPVTDAQSLTANVVRVGMQWDETAYFNGWMDELRIVKGAAVYTANFTPPTAAHTSSLFSGWDAVAGIYYIYSAATTLDSDGDGCWNNKIYTAGSVTFDPATDTGYNTCDSTYYISGAATTLDGDGDGCWNNKIYTAGSVTFDPATDTGYNTCDSTYYISGVATTLDSTGYGDYDGVHYSAYPTAFEGWDSGTSTYYFAGVATPLNSDGNGCWDFKLYTAGSVTFDPATDTGYNSCDSTYYIDGVATPLNSDGNGCWDNKIYTAGSVTFDPATDTGYSICDSVYYVAGVATTLDSTGYGDYDGVHYSAYPTAFEGWDSGTSTYYFAGVATTLNSSGTGDYDGALYLNGSLVVDGTTPRYFRANAVVSLESTGYWEIYLENLQGPGPFTCYSPPTSADLVSVNTYSLSGSGTVNNLYLTGTSTNDIDSYFNSTATVTVLGTVTVDSGYTNSGNITCANGVSFSNGSWNLGTVAGNASFNNSRNIGTVTGDATFSSNSENANDRSDIGYLAGYFGTVSGSATFNDTSTNNGVVSGTALFAGKRFNTGTVGSSVYTPTSPTTIYVADGGNDNNDGTEANPLANPQRAFEMAYYWNQATFTNSGTSVAPIYVRSGTPSITTSFSKFGGASLSCNGGIVGSVTAAIPSLASTDFTVEAWVYRPSGTGNATIFGVAQTGVGGLHFWINSNGAVHIDNFATAQFSGGSVPADEWVHIAAVGISGAYYCYINGVLAGSGSGTPLPGPYSVIYIGGWESFLSNILIDELRVVRGLGLYTTNFTPPTAPYTATPQTELLLHFNDLNTATTDRTIQIGSGSFGPVNLNDAYAANWPSGIQVKGVSAATSNLGGIIAAGNDIVFDYGTSTVVSNPTAGKNVTVISDNTVNLGNIVTTGGNSGASGVVISDTISGANSGNIVLTNCTAGMLATDGGGQFHNSMGSAGVGSTGSVTLTNSTVDDISAVSATLAGSEFSGSSGNAGTISLTNSTAGNIYAGASAFSFTYGNPAAITGGVVSLNNSTAGNIVVNGGEITYSNVNTSYSDYYGGGGGSVTLTNDSHVGNIVATGGTGGDTSNTSGVGGVVSLTDSTADDIIVTGANGGNNGYGQGGQGGSVTLTRSVVADVIAVGGTGGNSGGNVGGNGAAGGVVTITDSTAAEIVVIGGNGNSSGVDQAYGGHAGSITLVRSNAGPLYGVGGTGGLAQTFDASRTATGGNGGYVSLTDSNSGDITTFGGSGGSIGSNPASRGSVGTVILVGNCVLPDNIIGNLDVSDLNKGRGVNGSNILGVI